MIKVDIIAARTGLLETSAPATAPGTNTRTGIQIRHFGRYCRSIAKAVRAPLSVLAIVGAVLLTPPSATAGTTPEIERKAHTLLALEQMRCALMVERLQQALIDAGRVKDAQTIHRAKEVLTTEATTVLGAAAVERIVPKMIETLKTGTTGPGGDVAALAKNLESRCQGALNATEDRLDHWRTEAARKAPKQRRRQVRIKTPKPAVDAPVIVPVPSLQLQARPKVNFSLESAGDKDLF